MYNLAWRSTSHTAEERAAFRRKWSAAGLKEERWGDGSILSSPWRDPCHGAHLSRIAPSRPGQQLCCPCRLRALICAGPRTSTLLMAHQSQPHPARSSIDRYPGHPRIGNRRLAQQSGQNGRVPADRQIWQVIKTTITEWLRDGLGPESVGITWWAMGFEISWLKRRNLGFKTFPVTKPDRPANTVCELPGGRCPGGAAAAKRPARIFLSTREPPGPTDEMFTGHALPEVVYEDLTRDYAAAMRCISRFGSCGEDVDPGTEKRPTRSLVTDSQPPELKERF